MLFGFTRKIVAVWFDVERFIVDDLNLKQIFLLLLLLLLIRLLARIPAKDFHVHWTRLHEKKKMLLADEAEQKRRKLANRIIFPCTEASPFMFDHLSLN